MTPEEIIEYVNSVRMQEPFGSVSEETRPLMFEHIEECRDCQRKIRLERQLQDWLEQEDV